MNIVDIKPDSEITVTVRKDSASIEFRTKAVEPFANTILVDEILDDNEKPISFKSDGIYIEVMSLNHKQQPIIWKNVMIRHINVGGKDYHRIAQTTEGRATNRRNAYRLPVNKSAVAQLGLNTKGINIIIKDMSTNGFSFISKEDIEIIPPITVRITVTFDNKAINLSGIAIRKQKIANRKDFIYACKTNKFNKELDKFIMEQQREKAKQKNKMY